MEACIEKEFLEICRHFCNMGFHEKKANIAHFNVFIIHRDKHNETMIELIPEKIFSVSTANTESFELWSTLRINLNPKIP